MLIWRLVGVKGTLDEIENKWTLKDLFDAHEKMDLEEEIQQHYAQHRGGT